MGVHTGIIMGDDFFVFVNEVLVVGQIFISDFFQDEGKVSYVVDTEKEFEVGVGLVEFVEEGVKGFVNGKDFG